MSPTLSSRFARYSASRRGALALVLGALLLGTALAGCGGTGGQPDALAVASVDGHPISLSDYQTLLAVYQALDAQQNLLTDWQSPSGRANLTSEQQQSLNMLINIELMREQLKKPLGTKALNAARAQLMATRASLVQQEPSTTPLVQALTPRAIELFAEQSAYQSALAAQVMVPSYSARIIEVKTLATAQSLEQQAMSGADFGQLAHNNSLDSGTAAQNGAIGTIYQGEGIFTAPFDTEAFGSGACARPTCVVHGGTRYVIVPFQGNYMLVELTQPKSVSFQSIANSQAQQNAFSWWLTHIVQAHASIQQNVLVG